MGFFLRPIMCSMLFVVLSTGFLVLVRCQYMIDKTKVVEDKALHGYHYRSHANKTEDECFLNCYMDCFCMAFQICKKTECQLLSSNQFQSPSALVFVEGCSYYDMLPDLQQINTRGCNPLTPCQSLENLCQNGGSYVPLAPTDSTTPRYQCKCQNGYTGHLCKHSIKSCRAYSGSSQVPGKYQVLDDDMNFYEVFCDFDSNTKTVWTLVASYERQKKDNFDRPYYEDWPVNENSPRWDEYRLSKSKMQTIQNDSTKIRITCKFDTDGLMYDDFLVANKHQIDILNFKYRHTTSPPVCSRVEYVNIRGEDCAFCTMLLFQDSYSLHADSDKTDDCEFKSTGSKHCGGPGEDNFGHYGCVNPAHRCSSSPNATTQIWLGAVW